MFSEKQKARFESLAEEKNKAKMLRILKGNLLWRWWGL
jgi:hypothetical protein